MPEIERWGKHPSLKIQDTFFWYFVYQDYQNNILKNSHSSSPNDKLAISKRVTPRERQTSRRTTTQKPILLSYHKVWSSSPSEMVAQAIAGGTSGCTIKGVRLEADNGADNARWLRYTGGPSRQVASCDDWDRRSGWGKECPAATRIRWEVLGRAYRAHWRQNKWRRAYNGIARCRADTNVSGCVSGVIADIRRPVLHGPETNWIIRFHLRVTRDVTAMVWQWLVHSAFYRCSFYLPRSR